MPINSLIICEGESEKNFLITLQKQNKITPKYGKLKIILLKSWGRLKRIRTIYPGYDHYIFIHDTDDKKYVGDKLEAFKNTGVILYNNPNFDFFCIEFLGIKIKNPTNEKVVRKIREKYGKGKNIDYEQLLKDGSFQNLKNNMDYDFLELIDI